MLLYLLRGDLPWMNLNTRTREEKHQRIKEVKLNTSLQDLCLGLPDQFVTYMAYCRNLNFEEQPNYLYLRRLMRDLQQRCQFNNNFVLDWTIQKFNAIDYNSFVKDDYICDKSQQKDTSKKK